MTFSSLLSTKKDASEDSGGAAVVRRLGNSGKTQKVVLKPASAKVQAPPPCCKGHEEPCLLRKVKKSGPNKDREFWVCSHPVGSKSDPQARCDHFQWAS